MKKVFCVLVFLLVVGIFFVSYEEKSLALEKENYYETINTNISDSYKTVVLEIGEIRQDMLKMQTFFVEEPENLPSVSDSYYSNLVNLSVRFNNLSKYVLNLSKACDLLDGTHNDYCVSYEKNVREVQDNYKRLISDYNDVANEYNARQGNVLKVFED